MEASKDTALVTGASAGIGAEFCRQLAERCGRIIAVARRGERLDELKAELGHAVEIHPVVADLTVAADRERVVRTMEELGPVDFLVNNAGLGTFGEFNETELPAQQRQVDLHITATLALTHATLPGMIERGRGTIINLSSTAAFSGKPRAMVYCGSKAFLNLFSRGLQAEVAEHGIKVQSLCPGFTCSEFHDREGVTRAGFRRDQVPEEMWMEASEVVAQSLAALDGGQVTVLTGDHNREAARADLLAQADELS
ncbi:MAG: SDR family NAD(P)-dependent oxidoreductase [Gammaproteobacteria bacterium]|jgi:short-subunit dehydrogenase|nr:SDR family NAD(P)-dependent oxidoreductase [Gammaproteobacteria bacterium]